MKDKHEVGSISRRDAMAGSGLLALLALGAGLKSTGTAEAAEGIPPDFEVLKKVLIERLLNTRYYIGEDGSVVVFTHDEVWPGDGGGAQHSDWLFNSVTGLKTDAHPALEETIYTDIEHEGIPDGWDLSNVKTICDLAQQTELLGDTNLAYQVLREKIHVETHGAHEVGVQYFRSWVADSPELDAATKQTIDAAVQDYLAQAFPSDEHDWY